MSETAGVAITIVHSVLVIVDIVGNSLVCVIIKRNRDMRYVENRMVRTTLIEILKTAARLAQLGERQSAVREVEGSRMCCLCNYICKWLDIEVFSDKDYKP